MNNYLSAAPPPQTLSPTFVSVMFDQGSTYGLQFMTEPDAKDFVEKYQQCQLLSSDPQPMPEPNPVQRPQPSNNVSTKQSLKAADKFCQSLGLFNFFLDVFFFFIFDLII